ncbi:MAG: methylaspartate mutase, partial [Armatimonadota bacterium]
AVGKLLDEYAKQEGINVLGVDIGGATTDVFSVFQSPTGERVYNRTVSANLGMSYSICNVLKEAGAEGIARWLPFEMNPAEVRNRLRNKMIRPTTIPQTYEDLLIEHAVSREALRLAFDHHKKLARNLMGSQQQRDVGQIFSQEQTGQTLVNMMKLDMLIGSGGVLSHAPQRAQAALMMMDAYQPEGVTMLTVDSIFMMPHLGVISEYQYDAAREVFERDCIVRIGTLIAPVGVGKDGDPCVTIRGAGINVSVPFGEVRVIPFTNDMGDELVLTPAKGFDLGADRGKEVRITKFDKSRGKRNQTTNLIEGTVGLIVDTRGRPLNLDLNTPNRTERLQQALQAFGLPLPGKMA